MKWFTAEMSLGSGAERNVKVILPKKRKGEVVCWLFAADRDVAFRLGYNLWADQLFSWSYGEWDNPIDRMNLMLPAIFPEYDHGKIWHQMTRHLPHIRWYGGSGQ